MGEVDIRPLKADSIYAVDDPECCYVISEASELLDDFGSYSVAGEPRQVGLVREVASLWIVNIPTKADDDGWIEESEVRYFNSEADARAAYAAASLALGESPNA